MSHHTVKADEMMDFSQGVSEHEPSPEKRAEAFLKGRSGGRVEGESPKPSDGGGKDHDPKPVFDSGSKELDPEPPPVTDDPTDGFPKPSPEQIAEAKREREARRKARAS